ncbi:MAG: sigma 54 modulation/S30EA ribosomal C-terminal domain-containing protein [Acidimicrobiia bacterium]
MTSETTGAEVRDVVVATRGDVTDDERDYGRHKVALLVESVEPPVLFARLDLDAHRDPARERPAFAKAELDLNGAVVRAHSAAATMHEAVDALDARLRERVARAQERARSEHLRHRGAGEGVWQHGEETPRAAYFPRPPEEREIVRHKTPAYSELHPDEAAEDLELLDHDFFLFRNLETGEDNVIARVHDERGGYELFEPSATCSLDAPIAPIVHSPVRPVPMEVDAAREMLDLTEAPFVFFVGPRDGRGRVLYRRYDGHYGLIVPEDLPA